MKVTALIVSTKYISNWVPYMYFLIYSVTQSNT